MKLFIPVYQCPSAPDNRLVTCCGNIPGPEDAAETNYAAIATHEPDTVIYYAKTENGSGVMFVSSKIRVRDIVDGTAETIVVAEADYDNFDPERPDQIIGKLWASENRVTTAYGINSGTDRVLSGVESHHSGGAQFTFADGHVRFIGEEIDHNVLIALTTRASSLSPPGLNEVIDETDF